jgi:peptidoglycan hydrolase-like protein with peptidoglycan-binding domain
VPLQRLLQLRVDGLGGPGTRSTLFDWQSSHGLKPDAVFGPVTAAAMLTGW